MKCKDILVQEVNPWLETYYGLCIENSQPIQVNAKLLSPPKIINEVKNQGGVEVIKGSWRNDRVLKSSKIPGKNGLLQMVSLVPDFKIENLVSMDANIRKKAKEMAISFPDEANIVCCKFSELEEHIKKVKYSFVVILPGMDYGGIKNFESDANRIQCITAKIARKICGKNLKVMENILWKYNKKVRGDNWNIDIRPCPEINELFKEFTMIMGADVTHFTEMDNKPSLAAVVGSYNKSATSFYSAVSPLYPEEGKKSVEYISSIQEILGSFVKKGKIGDPKNVIYLRDGVSKGQFENTAMKELKLMKALCPNTKFAVIVCTKIHDQRFVKKMGASGYSNLNPGTIIDENVVDANYFNFYLCSHATTEGMWTLQIL